MRQHTVVSVDPGSVAERLKIAPGFKLMRINGENVEDVIDYEHLTTEEQLTLVFADQNGNDVTIPVKKDLYEPLGLNFETGLMSTLRSCKNHCIFCFIDQMPKGGRKTLHVKDDDWRLSLIMGNYVTLTNVSDEEFERILKRRVSPLYVSVHATDPEVRRFMMKNPAAGLIRERLERLKSEGLNFHVQIVLCPTINDGAILEQTLEELYALRPAARSVAVVPVGLTKFRDKLSPLRCLTTEEARVTIDQLKRFQERSIKEYGDAFVYASDELYINAGLPLPPYEHYGDFEQIENGVGLLRRFEEGFLYALEEQKPLKKKVKFLGASGICAAPFLQKLFQKLEPYNIFIDLRAVKNDYFGHTVTVSGLVCAHDIASQLCGIEGEMLLIPTAMLREKDDVFLDGVSREELERVLGKRVVPLCASDGELFVAELFELLRKEV
jgi:putative radical SAM enzyme (TIGR03279 family)